MNSRNGTQANSPPRTIAISVRYWREGVLVLICLAMLAGFMVLGPIAQNPAYHDFADHRVLLGVPNLFDVASNIPFLVIGVAGILLCAGKRRPPFVASWSALFIGTALVCFGSGYYHWAPSNEALLWDRLPMTVPFMALFVALVSEHVGEGLERFMLVPALTVGLVSAIWWHFTDDLRVYYWVQFTPLVCIPFVLAVFPGRYTHRSDLLYGLTLYVLAKFAETWDREIFEITANAVSGHTLKHLLAAGALLAVFHMLRRREPVAAPRL